VGFHFKRHIAAKYPILPSRQQRIQLKIGDGELNAGIELVTITSVGRAEIVQVTPTASVTCGTFP